MTRLARLAGLLCLVLFLLASPAAAQQTVGLFLDTEEAFVGYNLYGPLRGFTTRLIDNQGRLVNQWSSAYAAGFTAYLLPDGHLLRCGRYQPAGVTRFNKGGRGGRVEKFAWDGTIVWDYIYSDATVSAHHDIEPLPNGNVLLVAWELKTEAEAIQAGRAPSSVEGEIWPDHVIEVAPTGASGGTIVWEWHAWDHLIQDFDPTKDNYGAVADHPELIDANFLNGRAAQPDWFHVNAIDYHAELDQIVLSVPFFDEIWVIDHSTTTAQAAGHTGGHSSQGGDLIYRWGNPQAYRRGTAADHRLFFEHDAEWIEPGLPGAGNILVFNNRNDVPEGDASSVDEIVPPVDVDGKYTLEAGEAYGPAAPTWSYAAPTPTDFYAGSLAGAQRLPNGNTLIDEAQEGNFFEVTPAGQIVWRYVNPLQVAGPVAQGDPPGANNVFRVDRYAPDYPGLTGKDLTPGDLLEIFTPPLRAPDGTSGTASLLASRLDTSGTMLEVQWDTASCASFDYHLLHGALADVASHTLAGSECGVGTSGIHDWLSAPAGDLFFLIVGVDATGVYESSWGTDSTGAERNGVFASGLCSSTNKVATETCP